MSSIGGGGSSSSSTGNNNNNSAIVFSTFLPPTASIGQLQHLCGTVHIIPAALCAD